MTAAVLLPCPGCGALYPPSDAPTHRYLGASAGCFALFSWYMVANPEASGMLAESRIPEAAVAVPPASAEPSLAVLIGDAYGVQHHGEEGKRPNNPPSFSRRRRRCPDHAQPIRTVRLRHLDGASWGDGSAVVRALCGSGLRIWRKA